MKLRTKIVLILLVFSLFCSASILAILMFKAEDLKQPVYDRAEDTAIALLEKVDRNLFERYGDVQAFGLNTAAHQPENWRSVRSDNALLNAIHGYMTNYGLYKIMLLVDTQGNTLAVNGVNPKGKPLETGFYYERNFAETSWFKAVRDGRFTDGRNGLTGTYVEGPYPDADVITAYGADSRVIVFAAAVKDNAGTIIGYWANFADFQLVEDIIADEYVTLKELGLPRSRMTLIDAKGNILLDYMEGRSITPPGDSNLSTVYEPARRALALGDDKGATMSAISPEGTPEVVGLYKTGGAYDYAGLGWSMLVRYHEDEALAGVTSSIRDVKIGIAGVAGMALLASMLLGAMLTSRIRSFAEKLAAIAEGDTSIAIPEPKAKDEIRALFGTTRQLRDSMDDAFRLKLMVEDMNTNILVVNVRDGMKITYLNRAFKQFVKEQLGVSPDDVMGEPLDALHSSLGRFHAVLSDAQRLPYREKLRIADDTFDIAVSAVNNKNGEYVAAMMTFTNVTAQVRLADNFEASVKSVVAQVSTAASQMRSSAEILSGQAQDTKQRSSLVSQISTETAHSSSQVAAASEELTASIGEISSQVQRANDVAGQANTQARSIGDAMNSLVEKSTRVGEVIQFITQIANQINLLALNATIESARAGEAGKGFAVVASEVKTLANQTGKATEEITTQVHAMQSATESAVRAVEEIINIISTISASTTGVAAAIEEQSAATNEISRNISHAATGSTEISRNIGKVEEGAELTGTSARQVLDSASALVEQAALLSAKVDEFLVTVRNS